MYIFKKKKTDSLQAKSKIRCCHHELRGILKQSCATSFKMNTKMIILCFISLCAVLLRTIESLREMWHYLLLRKQTAALGNSSTYKSAGEQNNMTAPARTSSPEVAVDRTKLDTGLLL